MRVRCPHPRVRCRGRPGTRAPTTSPERLAAAGSIRRGAFEHRQDPLETPLELLLRDHERWGEPEGALLRVLRQDALPQQPFGRTTSRPRGLDELDPGPEAASADLLDGRDVPGPQRRMQVRAEPRRRLLELAGPEHRDDSSADRAGDGVAPERAAMLPRLEHPEDLLVRN